MKIIYSPEFSRRYAKLPEKACDLAERKEQIFRLNPFDPSLRTHKLKGKLKGLYAFSIGPKYRIIFEFGEDHSKVYFQSIGNHDIYK